MHRLKQAFKHIAFSVTPTTSIRLSYPVALPPPQPKPQKNVAAYGPVSIIRLDRVGQGVESEIRADASFDVAEQIDVAGVAERILADPE
jgi:hypothetical protein